MHFHNRSISLIQACRMEFKLSYIHIYKSVYIYKFAKSLGLLLFFFLFLYKFYEEMNMNLRLCVFYRLTKHFLDFVFMMISKK